MSGSTPGQGTALRTGTEDGRGRASCSAIIRVVGQTHSRSTERE